MVTQVHGLFLEISTLHLEFWGIPANTVRTVNCCASSEEERTTTMFAVVSWRKFSLEACLGMGVCNKVSWGVPFYDM